MVAVFKQVGHMNLNCMRKGERVNILSQNCVESSSLTAYVAHKSTQIRFRQGFDAYIFLFKFEIPLQIFDFDLKDICQTDTH